MDQMFADDKSRSQFLELIHRATRVELERIFEERRKLEMERKKTTKSNELWRPRMHLRQCTSQNTMTVTLECPGMKKGDVNLTIDGRRLVVSGDRRPEPVDPDDYVLFDEIKSGRIERTIPLPPGVQHLSQISASMEDGLLTICWPIKPNYNPVRS